MFEIRYKLGSGPPSCCHDCLRADIKMTNQPWDKTVNSMLGGKRGVVHWVLICLLQGGSGGVLLRKGSLVLRNLVA